MRQANDLATLTVEVCARAEAVNEHLNAYIEHDLVDIAHWSAGVGNSAADARCDHICCVCFTF